MEQDLFGFLNDSRNTHCSIKSEFKYSKGNKEVLNMLLYKDKNSHLHTTICKKPTYRQSYVHSK